MLRTKKSFFISIIFLGLFYLSCFSSAAYADTNNQGVKVKWGYKGNTGPERWARLDPSFVICAKGKSQSPINIAGRLVHTNSELTINYHLAPLLIINDGTTDVVIGNTRTIFADGHGVQLNFLPSIADETIIFNGKIFRLVELHIHTPSETALNGEIFPMEIHFVHQGGDGQLAVIAVWFRGGIENRLLSKIIKYLPKEKGKAYPIPQERINPLTLLPLKRDYYSYAGSLTTPPCSESVQWIVMAQSMTASPAQIVILKEAMGGANARPPQPLNQRTVSYSTEQHN